MGRKLRHVMMFLIIFMMEPNMPEADCNALRSCQSSSCRCDRMRLTRIPQNLPKSTTHLSLQNNQLTTLRRPELSSIQRLSLRYNRITDITPGTFVGPHLHMLQSLNLERNQITKIRFGTFSELPQLVQLLLRGNRITSMVRGAFSKLPKLQQLDLSWNRISNIRSSIFRNLPSLRFLYLRSNQISVLPLSIYDTLASMSVVMMHNNPWQCDCRMAPFRKKMTRPTSFMFRITCAQPASLAGQNLNDVNLKDLICEGPTTTSALPDNAPAKFTTSEVMIPFSFGNEEGNIDPGNTQAKLTSLEVPISFSFGNAESTTDSGKTITPYTLDVSISSLYGNAKSNIDPIKATVTPPEDVSKSPTFGNPESNTDSSKTIAPFTPTEVSSSFGNAKSNIDPSKATVQNISPEVPMSPSFANPEGTSSEVSIHPESNPVRKVTESASSLGNTGLSNIDPMVLSTASTTLGTPPVESQWKTVEIVKIEPLTPPFATTAATSDKPEMQAPVPDFPLPVLIGSVCGSVGGTLLLVSVILAVWWNKRAESVHSGPAPNVVFTTPTVMTSGHDQAITESNTHTIALAGTSDHDQTGQGQSQVITGSNTHTIAVVGTSGQDHTGQGQSQIITESNPNTTALVGASGNGQASQVQANVLHHSPHVVKVPANA
ncbi:hypothetical protein Bbelb_332420 [Branchiostoma belcheri]|nr:hypothetical protein Bbelb_332420 [Branchiostoma belcheri]